MKIITAVVITAILTFTVTENYMLNTLHVRPDQSGYVLTVFGRDFTEA